MIRTYVYSFCRTDRPFEQESSSASVCSWKNVSKGSQKNADRGPANQTLCQASERIDWLAGSDILSSISKDYREEKRGRHQQRKQMERRVDQVRTKTLKQANFAAVMTVVTANCA